ncbi:hypothetical protein [Tunturibacter empetritectus]|uniref:Uncharacterized protein n=1 Tax=Tunturiibacter lichenicola TaxID=2051959 RepID=A0A7W8N4W8_9BACT|nr:hypothetical protein [Edaphobacter lichenicola]MBB5343355.1 hypothetical protein [Edaphobacter lichenicola]
MQSEDEYLDRTPDLVAKVRAMREAAEKEMNRFTVVADYDVRRVVGQKPQASPISVETVPPSPSVEQSKKTSSKPSTVQTSIQFAPAPSERGDDGEGA